MQDLPDAVTVFLEIGEQSIDAGRRHADHIRFVLGCLAENTAPVRNMN